MHTKPWSQTRGAMAVAVAATLAVTLAGCGGSSPTSSTTGGAAANQSAGAAANQNPAAAAFKYADCMRSHGVSKFPDPQVSTGNGQTSVRQAVPAGVGQSPRFKSAQRACRGIMPAVGNGPSASQRQARTQAIVTFARCMRSHGVPTFPDPSAQGQLPLTTVEADGVNIHAPAFLTGARACVGVTHGVVTFAQIEQAVSGGS